MESTQPEENKIAADTTATTEQQPAATAEPKKGGKAEREAAKAARLLARQQPKAAFQKDPNDPCADKFGDLPLNRSQSDPEKRYEKKFIMVHDLDETFDGQEVIIRGRLHKSNAKSKKLTFLTIRERFATVQAILEVNLPNVSENMAAYAANIPKESIIEVKAKVTVPPKPIQGTSQKVEL
jgi:aspartyl-tRNA synthetase